MPIVVLRNFLLLLPLKLAMLPFTLKAFMPTQPVIAMRIAAVMLAEATVTLLVVGFAVAAKKL
jgi:hypothetical protein